MGLLRFVTLLISTVVLSLKLILPLTVSLSLPFVALSFSSGLSANTGINQGQRNVRRHVVRPGESLSSIAQNYGFDVYELVQFNQLYNPNSLMAGQAIYLPGDDVTAVVTRQPLNATSFPPANAAPSQEDYYHMQQMLGGQPSAQHSAPGALPEVESVDYNYSRKIPEESSKKKTEDSDAVTEAQKKSGSKSGDKTKEEEKASSTVAETDPEEEIDDSFSPALTTFGDRPYAYYGSGENLVDVLQNFAASYYVPTIIAEDVLGEVNGKVGPLTPVAFLDHMANVYGFIWYFDGHSLYVYNGSAAQQQIISLGFMTTDNFKKTLKKVGIWDGRFFWKAQPKEGLIYISGPPRYVEMVTQTASLLDEKEGDRQKSRLSVRMFRLKYAWATDKRFNFRGQEADGSRCFNFVTKHSEWRRSGQCDPKRPPQPNVDACKKCYQIR